MSSAGTLTTCLMMLTAVGMYFTPDATAARVHGMVMDSFSPAQTVVRQSVAWVTEGFANATSQAARSQSKEIEQLRDQLRCEQARASSLQLQLARRTDNDSREAATPAPLRSLPPLVSSSLIEAKVLGDALAESWRSGKLLNRGDSNGVREFSLVVQNRHPLVDLGRDGELSPEDALLLGRCVVGKIERVGRWTSTVLLVTDAEYRGRAQLIHQTDSGFVFGAKGILKGQGDSKSPQCRLDGIDASDSVSVGDEVYTASRDGLPATPLYYGRVTEATLGPDDKEWKVLVDPVPIPHDLTTVQILRTSVTSGRL